jgi:glycosyltransferase involved in cell wall biosynthesis
MVHDTIPLDHPEFAGAGSVEPFRRKMAAVAGHADRVVHLTAATRKSTEAQLARFGRVPPGCVAPLGVDRPVPDLRAVPPGLDLTAPYFIALGTIEPRKNIGLLLDAWDVLPRPPRLFLVGARGWIGADLAARLDALPVDGPIRELNDLSDGAVARLLAGAQALLFPSHAEGFGLPPLEAAALGTPVVSQHLPVIQELLGDYPVYLTDSNRYSWAEKVEELVWGTDRANPDGKQAVLPDWDAHFNTVLNLA